MLPEPVFFHCTEEQEFCLLLFFTVHGVGTEQGLNDIPFIIQVVISLDIA